jgi:putative holliday junction resolvase
LLEKDGKAIKDLNGKEHVITFAARRFIQSLIERFSVAVYAAEERLTSVEARARLYEKGGYKALSKQAIDSLSAQLILEGWLHERYSRQ